MTNIHASLIISFIERYVLIAISLGSNILLARLLSPDEIGVYSVSLAVIAIAQVLRDFGIGNFLVQEKNLTEEHIKTAFGFSLIVGCLLFIVTYFSATFAGEFYREQRMVNTLQICALNFLTLPFSTISLALLRRDMAFKRLAFVNLIAAIVSFCTSIGLAYSGFGSKSLAVASVALNITTGIGTWLARSDYKFLLPGFSEWRVILHFGGQNTVAGVVTTISMNINDLVIGRILGFTQVAMISRAQAMMNLFNQDIMGAIRNVVFPAFSKIYRERGGDYIESYHNYSVCLITLIAWPFYGFIAIHSTEIIRIMFGTQWDEASQLVPVFCLAGGVAAISNLVLNCIMAVARIDLVVKSELIFQPIRASLIVFAAFYFKTLYSCALAYLISFVLYTLLVYWIKQKCIPNDFQRLTEGILASFKVTIIALSLPLLLWINNFVNFKIAFVIEGLWISFEFHNEIILVSNGVLFFLVFAVIIFWFIAIILVRHPVVLDPLFIRLTNNIFTHK
jgi:lipopolysaccharide exporter